jgi:DNA repair exonuclease SbcCD nuclease subunit
MGDTFDSRKGIDFGALTWAKNNYYDRLKEMGITVHTIVGNHTAYYKNTNDINAVDLLLREYDNVKIYSEATPIEVDGLSVLLVPWINKENEEQTLEMINKTRSPVCMGHLELVGFRVHRGYIMEHGTDASIFNKFEKVFSGHYHTRSDNGKIFYLGNPYEMYWNDCNDTRGFHIFDTETLEVTSIDNPYNIFRIIYFEDNDHQLFDARPYENKIVKVVVKKKSDQVQFEKFLDKLYNANVAELKIVENFALQEASEFEAFESEDTLSILNRYIEEAEINLDRSRVQKLIQEVYQEACELV